MNLGGSANGNDNGNGRCRVVVTGGPGVGKTTAADLFRRELGDRVVIVPEAATLLFAGGFPRSSEVHARRAGFWRPSAVRSLPRAAKLRLAKAGPPTRRA